MNIRPSQRSDLPDLADFLTDNGMVRQPDTLQWKFRNTPETPAVSQRSFIAEMGGRIVGHIGILPTEIHVQAGRSCCQPAAWFVDWMVREDLRSRGIGILLLREAAKHIPVLMTIQGSADTQTALPQLRWQARRILAVYKLNACLGALPPHTSPSRRLAVDLAHLLRYHPVRYAAPRGWQLQQTTVHHDNETLWNDLDEAVHATKTNMGAKLAWFHRSAAFLSWSFRDHPNHHYELAIAYNNGKPAGYAVWRMVPRSDGRLDGRIVDAQVPGPNDSARRWLISAVTGELADRGAVQISCLAGVGSPLANALTRNRFLPRQTLPLWISPEAEPITEDMTWHTTYADSDIETASEP